MTTRAHRVLRERILVEGMKGTGKTFHLLKLARYCLKQGNGAVFRIVDTDDSYYRMLETEFPDLIPEEGGNVYVYPVYEWPEYVEAKNILLKEAQQGDWNVIDMADNAWKAVQSYFVAEVFKKDIGDYFLMARKELAAHGDKTAKGKEARNLQPMKGWTDWVVINAMYDSFMLPIIYKGKAHLYMTTGVDVVSKDDDEDTRDLYGPFGVKPRGQKNLAHQVHTEFLFQQGDRQGKWEITTIKDRGRRQYDHAPLLDLPKQYFVGVVGW